MEDDFTIRVRLELGIQSQARFQGEVVVNLSINSHNKFLILINQRLGTGV